MGQRGNDAAVTGAQIKLRKGECASGMVQRGPRRNVTGTGAQIKSTVEECAGDMGQSANYATVTGAQIKL